MVEVKRVEDWEAWEKMRLAVIQGFGFLGFSIIMASLILKGF
jgi:hypothetical protein